MRKVLSLLHCAFLLVFAASCASHKAYHPEKERVYSAGNKVYRIDAADNVAPEPAGEPDSDIVVPEDVSKMSRDDIARLVVERDRYRDMAMKAKAAGETAEMPEITDAGVAKGDSFAVIADNLKENRVSVGGKWNFDGALTKYPYGANKVYDVFVTPRNITDIKLEPGETIGQVVLGDTTSWFCDTAKSVINGETQCHVLIRPNNVNIMTDCMITTDRRQYYLRLVSSSQAAQTSVEWVYPYGASSAGFENIPSGGTRIDLFNRTVSDLVFAYRIKGSAAWRPERVYSDGERTYIQFPKSFLNSADAPVCYLRRNGRNELVNFSVKGITYIVPLVMGEYDSLVLKAGSSEITVSWSEK